MKKKELEKEIKALREELDYLRNRVSLLEANQYPYYPLYPTNPYVYPEVIYTSQNADFTSN